jgi:hypothetical protein
MTPLHIALALAGVCAPLFTYGAARSLVRFYADAVAEWQQVPAPIPGADRAGGSSNGYPAPQGVTARGAAAAADHRLAKDGNGALHNGEASRSIAPMVARGVAAFSFTPGRPE